MYIKIKEDRHGPPLVWHLAAWGLLGFISAWPTHRFPPIAPAATETPAATERKKACVCVCSSETSNGAIGPFSVDPTTSPAIPSIPATASVASRPAPTATSTAISTTTARAAPIAPAVRIMRSNVQ